LNNESIGASEHEVLEKIIEPKLDTALESKKETFSKLTPETQQLSERLDAIESKSPEGENQKSQEAIDLLNRFQKFKTKEVTQTNENVHFTQDSQNNKQEEQIQTQTQSQTQSPIQSKSPILENVQSKNESKEEQSIQETLNTTQPQLNQLESQNQFTQTTQEPKKIECFFFFLSFFSKI